MDYDVASNIMRRNCCKPLPNKLFRTEGDLSICHANIEAYLFNRVEWQAANSRQATGSNLRRNDKQ